MREEEEEDQHELNDSPSFSIPLPSQPQIQRRRRGQKGQRGMKQQPAVNVIVASDAGKPIYARFGTSTEIARICGHLQALRCSILYDIHLGGVNNNPLGDLQCIQSSNGSMLVFMHVESIWLVAIAKTKTTNNNKTSSSTSSSTITQAYLRLLLEHVYSQLIFHLTNHVQVMFQQNASLDLQSILLGNGSSTSSSSINGLMHSLLNQADVFISTTTTRKGSDCDTIDNDDDKCEEEEEQHEHENEVLTSDDGDEEPNDNDDDMAINHHNNNNPAPFLSSSIPILFPLSNHIREKTSKILQTIGQEETQHCVFSILFTTTTTTTTTTNATANKNNINVKDQQEQQPHDFPPPHPSCECKLLTLVQPSFRSYQLRTTDLNLLMHFCSQQLENNSNHNSQGASTSTSAASAELWLPVCLPRFHASGFLYCYTTRLEMMTTGLSFSSSSQRQKDKKNNNHLTLALLSQMGSTEQFQLFRTAARRIRRELGLPMPKESPILTIQSCPNANTTDQIEEVQPTCLKNHNNDSGDDIAWRRRSLDDSHEDEEVHHNRHDTDRDHEFRDNNHVCHEHSNNDEDYVDASGDGNGIIPYVGITDQQQGSSLGGQVISTFCTEVQSAMDHVYVQDFVTKEYLRDLIITTSSISSSSSSMFVRHFLFRFNAPIRIMSCDVKTNNNSNSHRHFRLWNNASNNHYRHNNSFSTSSTNSTNSSSTTATTTTSGHLTQCISSWLGNNDDNHDDDEDYIHLQNKIWTHYQKLNLRLRLGSASFESVLGAWDMITAHDSTAAAAAAAADTSASTESNNNNRSSSPGIGRHCPAMGLLESPPNFINGLTYVVDGTETYLGMSGQEFELYVVLSSSPSSSSSSSTFCNSTNTSISGDNHHTEKGKHTCRSIPVQQGAALAARLARRLLLDQNKLFIAEPFTWKQS